MNKILILICALGFFLSCSNDDNDSVYNEIVGEWQLIEARIIDFSTNPSIDYSGENIIFNFQSNGTLIVTGGDNVGYPVGEYEYIFAEDYLGGAASPGEEKILLVKVNNSTKWTYNKTGDRMVLGNSYVDGPDLIFK